MCKSMLALFVLAVILFSVEGRIYVDNPELEQESRCGGPIESDFGTLTFPIAGQDIKAGEVCIYTIHLLTKSTFRLNFESIDIIGDDANCTGGAIRLYSLTNLIPASKSEGYTFCNEQPPSGGSFILSESLITVIVRSEYNSSEAGAGFTLNWEGIAVQPIPKTHESTYTTATSGIIRYPIEGKYPPNTVSTWLIKGGEARPDLRLYLTAPYVSLESCSLAPEDDCLCDALIIYEVASTGVLHELERLCGDANGTEITNFGPNVVIAFFTDHVDEEGAGAGFEVIYRPEFIPSTTPAPPVVNETTTCGGVISGLSGSITYKYKEHYDDNERCVWQIRSLARSKITFHMQDSELEDGFDWVIIQTLNATDIHERHGFTGARGGTVTLEGTVAIVIFHSDDSYSYRGFKLTFTADGPCDENLHHYVDYNEDPTAALGSLKYPESGLYENMELSTFAFTRPTGGSNSIPRVKMNITSLDLELGSDDLCRDVINVYTLATMEESILRKISGSGFCQTSQVASLNLRYDTIVIVLASDRQNQSTGFELFWEMVPL